MSNIQSKSNKLTNHERAIIYSKKQELLGKPIIKFELGDFDRVILISVLDKESTGKITIPSFITDIRNLVDVFRDCQFTEILIDNQPDREFNASYLFSSIKSIRLKVKFSHPECISEACQMFSASAALKEVTIENFKSLNIKNMSGMFSGCINLRKVNTEDWDVSKVEVMDHMFNLCTCLHSLDVSTWDTSSLQSTVGMFYKCIRLRSFDISNWDTSNIDITRSMFYQCHKLTEVKFNKLNTSKLYDATEMFMGCKSLRAVDISGLELSKLELARSMFEGCQRLTSIDISNKKMNRLRDATRMFYYCLNLRKISFRKTSLSKIDNTDSISDIFKHCISLKDIDVYEVNSEAKELITKEFNRRG